MRHRLFSGLLAMALAVGACSVQDEPTGSANPDATPSAASAANESSEETTTTAELPASTAVILIGPARYELDAICEAGGAGELTVAATGTDANGKNVVGYIRAYEREPYVSVVVGDGDDEVRFEPRIEGVLPFEVTANGVTFPKIDFVSELNLSTGDFVPAGIGSLNVECLSYVRELPVE